MASIRASTAKYYNYAEIMSWHILHRNEMMANEPRERERENRRETSSKSPYHIHVGNWEVCSPEQCVRTPVMAVDWLAHILNLHGRFNFVTLLFVKCAVKYAFAGAMPPLAGLGTTQDVCLRSANILIKILTKVLLIIHFEDRILSLNGQ